METTIEEQRVKALYADWLEGATIRQVSERYGLGYYICKDICEKRLATKYTDEVDNMYLFREQQFEEMEAELPCA